ncbi:hypothetical protein [Pseudomonas sp. 06C 126]|uniref:hypothetical protein n=1 Tax=Pseudomonas sp. 06C 126 TaxID=1917281 RepID=UPI0008DA8938|nr:hypothetical protein [Pseudomonas sp. 06C 126]OHW37942.1 hypothetical protein BHC62_06385 [Pseudomonas sp. 06C 126]
MDESTLTSVAINIGCALIGFFANSLRLKVVDVWDARKIYKWLVAESVKPDAVSFRTTKAISRGVCMSPERVSDLCGRSKNIHLSTGKEDGLWTITRHSSPRGFFDM